MTKPLPGSPVRYHALLSLLALTTAVGAACGQGSETIATATESSQSPFVGDEEVVADESAEAQTVDVLLDVPAGTDLYGFVVVTLEDASLSDVPAVVLSRAQIPAGELSEQPWLVPLDIPIPLDAAADLTIAVHVDTDESGDFTQGDWLSPDVIPLPTDGSRAVTATLVRI